jgi:hypothetical protein
MEKCATLRDWVEERALVYLGVRTLLEAADYLYRQAAVLDDRLRLGEQLSEQETEKFVEEQAKNLIRTGIGEIGVRDSLKVVIEEGGYEEVAQYLKTYEEKKQEGVS